VAESGIGRLFRHSQQPTPDFTVRPVAPGDLSGCAAVYVEAFADPPHNLTWSLQDAEELLGVFLQREPSLCFCAEAKRTVIGIAFCSTVARYRATIEELAVLPAWQGKGVGKALLDKCLEELRGRGYTQVDLIANLRAPAMRFYERNGFRVVRHYAVLVKDL